MIFLYITYAAAAWAFMGLIALIACAVFDPETKSISLKELVGILFLGPIALLILMAAIIFFEERMGDIIIWKRK